MAFTNFAYLTQASSGATRNAGTNGDLNALLDWALTGNSNWVRLYHDGTNFYDVWQPAAGGPCLTVHHNSAQSGSGAMAVVRLCESASGASTYTDPVPTTSQLADTLSNWQISNGANTTTRDFHIAVWETGIIYVSRIAGATDSWEMGYAVKMAPRYAGDTTYPWLIGVRNSSNIGSGTLLNQTVFSNPGGGNSKNFILRNVAGTIKSEQALIGGRTTTLGSVGGCPAIGAGYGGTIDKEKVLVHASGSNTTAVGTQAIINRGAIPQLWTPLHNGLAGIGEADTLTEGSSTYVLLRYSGSTNGILLQTSNDWSGFPGG